MLKILRFAQRLSIRCAGESFPFVPLRMTGGSEERVFLGDMAPSETEMFRHEGYRPRLNMTRVLGRVSE